MKFWIAAICVGLLSTPGQGRPSDTQDAANHDWWLVSTSGYGAEQNRFYIDRNKMVSMEPVSRSWIDHYAVADKGRLTHSKALLVADCDDRAPRIKFETFVAYGDGTAPPITSDDGRWLHVVPDSSQETLWRFTCHSTPENAIVFVPDGPESDARRYFARAAAMNQPRHKDRP